MGHPIHDVLFADIAAGLGDRAFPVTIIRDDQTLTGTGLSKRELFAAMAMQGRFGHINPYENGAVTRLAEQSVAVADALLLALRDSSGESA